MRIIFHAGAPKTGTTALQAMLEANKSLLADAGIAYGSRQVRKGIVHPLYPVIKRLRSEADPSQLIEMARGYLASEAEGGRQHSLLLSYESAFGEPLSDYSPQFYPDLDRVAAALKAVFADHVLHIKWVTRPLVDFIPSYYVQYVRMGGTRSLEDFIATADKTTLSWTPVVRRLHQHFGEDAVQVFRYRDFRQTPDPFIRNLCAPLDAPLNTFDLTPLQRRHNATDGRAAVEIYRLINRGLNPLPARLRRRLRLRARRHLFPAIQKFSPKQSLELRPEVYAFLAEQDRLDDETLGPLYVQMPGGEPASLAGALVSA